MNIGIDYRPCIVHIPAVTQNLKNMNGKVTTKIIKEKQEFKGLFHCWSHRSELVGESPLRDGHPGGQISATFGLVEYEDGTMHEIEPQNIRFVDGIMKEYGFCEDGKE